MINQNVNPIIFLSVLAKYSILLSEARRQLFTGRPGLNLYLTPGPAVRITLALGNAGPGLKGAGVRRRGPQYASLLTHPFRITTYAIEFNSSLQAPLNLKGLGRPYLRPIPRGSSYEVSLFLMQYKT